METRKAKLIVTKGGSGSTTFRATLPTTWIRKMGLDENERNLILEFDGKEISIRKEDEEMGEKIFIGGYYDNRIFKGETFEGKTPFGKDINIYTLDEALKLGFVEPVIDWYEEQEEKEWGNLADEEKIRVIEKYTLDDDIAGLLYFKTEILAEQKKQEILQEIKDIEDEVIYIGKEQNKSGIFVDVYVKTEEYLKMEYLDKEYKLWDLDNRVQEILESNSIFSYDVRQMLEQGFCYEVERETLTGYEFSFEITEDNEQESDILVKVTNIEEIL